MKNKEKEVYQRPEIEIIQLDGCSDVIVTSLQDNTDTDYDTLS